MLNALQRMDQSYSKDDGIRIICIVTGEGPLKQYYIDLVEKLQLQHVLIKTM